MNSRRLWLWLIPALCYVLFALWYTNLSGPLTEAEISAFVQLAESSDAPPERIAMMRKFMQEDTGNQFIMVNNLDMAEAPPSLPATGPGASASELMHHYMGHMFPALFKRASHPAFFGRAVAGAMDLSGIENAEVWSQGALFRYRSRRDVRCPLWSRSTADFLRQSKYWQFGFTSPNSLTEARRHAETL